MPESTQQKKDHLTILTVRDVAAYLRISEAKVYRLARQRRIPVVRIGKTWRFRKDLLDAWIMQSAQSSLKSDGETSTAAAEPQALPVA